MRLSRLFLWLYRWSLRRSGPRGTAREYVLKVPIRSEYISTMPAIWGAEPPDVT